MKKFRHSLIERSESEFQDFDAPDFLFKNVNFSCSNLTNLIYLQNKSEDVKIVFDNCYFMSEK